MMKFYIRLCGLLGDRSIKDLRVLLWRWCAGVAAVAFCLCCASFSALAQQITNPGSGTIANTNYFAVPLTVDPYSGLSLTAPVVTPATNQSILAQIAAAAGIHQIVGAAPALETMQTAESRRIAPVPGGAVANFASHKAAFAANLNNVPAVDLWMRDGGLLRSHIYGLCYYAPNGQSVFFCDGEGC